MDANFLYQKEEDNNKIEILRKYLKGKVFEREKITKFS